MTLCEVVDDVYCQGSIGNNLFIITNKCITRARLHMLRPPKLHLRWEPLNGSEAMKCAVDDVVND